MSQNVINVNQALSLYMAFIQEQISALRRTRPAFVNTPVLTVGDPQTGQFIAFSYPQMLSEVQRRTPIGMNEAIKHAQGLGYAVTG